jgi:hypothetical protein
LGSSVATLVRPSSSRHAAVSLTSAPGSGGWRVDVLAAAGYLALAVIVTWPLWHGDAVLRNNRDDPILFQWVLAHAARVFTHGENPFFADQMNAPFGLNLMANTSVLGLAIPMVPVTLLFGPHASFLVLITTGLAGTAYAWYHVLSRHLVRLRFAAVVGGGFCGFAPGMIAQSNGHPNLTNQFLVPFIVLAVLRLRSVVLASSVRRGLVLAGLVVYQFFVNEEVLFLTALGLAVFVPLWAVQSWSAVRRAAGPALAAVGVCALVTGVVLAGPLIWQFSGPSAYHGLPFGVQTFGTDVLATGAYARESLFGSVDSAYGLASNASEENTFFGVPLLLVLVGVVVLLARSAAARALAATLVLFWALSLGPYVWIDGELSAIRGPWSWIDELPLFESVVPTRFGLALIPMIGVLLALALDRFPRALAVPGRPLWESVGAQRASRGWQRGSGDTGSSRAAVRPLWAAVIVTALLPIAPTPISVSTPHVPPTPVFFASGQWRSWVPQGGVVLPLPPGWVPYLSAMSWQTDTDLGFRIVGGYYLAPIPGDPSRRANFGPDYPPTMRLLRQIGENGGDMYVTDEHRELARGDFRVYGVTTLVLPAAHPHAADLRRLVEQLVGPGREVDDVWVWDVRGFVADP